VRNDHYTARVLYRCDEKIRRVDIPEADRCKPSVHLRDTWLAARFMPVCLSRGVGTVLDVRAKPVQDISPQDARAEGIERLGQNCYWRRYDCADDDPARWTTSEVVSFLTLFDSINAARGYGSDANPWVFAYTLRKEAAE